MDTPTDTQNAAPAPGGTGAKSRKGPTRSEVSKSAILEAAREVLRLGFEHYGLRRIVANLDARNHRSAGSLSCTPLHTIDNSAASMANGIWRMRSLGWP